MNMEVSSKVEKAGLFDDDYISRLSSTRKLGKMEASRLEIQWKKICDQEKRSKQRNRDLLKDFERVEQHAVMLAVKTDRLKTYKQQYENYINKMYPRWKEDLENYRLSRQQKRDTANTNASGSLVHPPKSDVYEPRGATYSHFSSTPAHSRTSVPIDNSVMYNRSHLESAVTGIQTSHSDSFFLERHSDFSRTQGDVPRASYPQQTDSRWQRPSSYNSYRQFDSVERPYQNQFVLTSGEPGSFYQRSPDHYRGQFFDTQQPPRALPRNLPPDLRYTRPELLEGGLQSVNPVAPYEGRTELQMSYLGHGGLRSTLNDQRGADRQPSGYFGDSRQVSDSRGMAFEVDKKFENRSSEIGPSMATRFDSSQDTNHLASVHQPLIPPEKPLEDNVPSPILPQPSQSSTLIKSAEERNDNHTKEIQQEGSVTLSTTSGPKETVQGRKTEEMEAIDGSIDGSMRRGPEGERSEVLASGSQGMEDAEKLERSSTEASKATMDASLPESLGKECKDTVVEEKHSLPELQESKQVKGAESSDDDESLTLSDISLPDGNEHYVPSALQKAEGPDYSDTQEFVKINDAAREEEANFEEVSKPAIDLNAQKSISEDISEDIPESIVSEISTKGSHFQLQEDVTPPGEPGDSSEQAKIVTDKNAQNEKKVDSDDVLLKDDSNQDAGGFLANKDTEKPVQMKTDEPKKPTITEDGFMAILQAVDADVEVSFSPEALYRSPQCSSDMRDEIIRAAETGSGLQSFDPNTVSMIALEELPLLLSSYPSGCLIPERVFTEGLDIKKEIELRRHVESSLIKLWKSLFSHLVNVVTNNVMNAEEIGKMFGPLLITKYSKFVKESQVLLGGLVEAAVSAPLDSPTPDDDLDLEPRLEIEASHKDDVSIASAASSSTLGSTPPQVQPHVPSEENRKPNADVTASYEDDFEEDVPLTETAAYLKMVGSPHSEPDDDVSDILGESGHQNQDESEADDDVERELARSISPPVTSPRTRSPSHSKSAKPKPRLSLFDTGVTEVDEDTNKGLGDSWGGSSAKSIKSEISDSESVASPPLSPDGLGYVPTALQTKDQLSEGHEGGRDLEKSERNSANESKAKRKTDFWNNSDTESEVDLQLSTGGFDEDDDDFDFYG